MVWRCLNVTIKEHGNPLSKHMNAFFNKHFLLTFCSILCSANARGESNPILSKYVPDGVHMGMGVTQLVAFKSNLVQLPVSPTTPDRAEYIDPPVHGGSPCLYHYLFKSGSLAAVKRSLSMRGKTVNEVQPLVRAIRADLKSNYTERGTSKVVRPNGSSVYLLTVELWQNNEHNQAFLLATDQEITLVFFDPAVFRKADFFIEEERQKEIQTRVNAMPTPTEISRKRNPPIDLAPSVLPD